MRSMSGNVRHVPRIVRGVRWRTGDVFIQNIIFFDHIVYELAALLVYNEDLPLPGISTVAVVVVGEGCGDIVRRRAWCCEWY